MLCKKCGAELEEGVKFCAACGEPVSGEDAVSEQMSQQENEAQSANDIPASQNEENESINQVAEGDEDAPVVYCINCGSTMNADDTVCSICGKPREETSVKKSFKFPLKPVILVAVIALIAVFIVSNFAYAKNAIMKLFMSPEKYFAYVVTSEADDIVDTFAENYDTVKGYIENGVGAKTELKLKKGEGLENFLSDIDLDDASEYIDWFESAAISFNTNTKDNVSDANIDLALNDVKFGNINYVADINDMMLYLGFPDYNSKYIAADMDTGYNSSDDLTESMEMAKSLLGAMPDKGSAKKLLMKYLEVVLNSVEKVEEKTTTITADGISQKITSLSIDVDGKLVKNIAINFLKELKDDKEISKIIDDIAEVVDEDASDLWESLDDEIEYLEDLDTDYFEADITFDVFVNSRGELVGFALNAEDVSVESYIAEKGNKFGAIFEVDADASTVRFKGNGKQFNNKRTGEFDLEIMGSPIVKFEVKNLDTKKFKKGLLDGSITLKTANGIEALRYAIGLDSDVIDVLSSMAITIKSSQNSFNKCDCTISLDYDDKAVMELKAKGSTEKPNNVKIPSDYIDAEDYDETEEWAESFNFDKLIDKMRDAHMPDEIIDKLEEAIEDSFYF